MGYIGKGAWGAPENGLVVQTIVTEPHAPLNGTGNYCQTLRVKCLDHFLILGERHFGHLVRQFAAHYNLERPHQAKGNVPLPEADANEPRILKFPSGEIKCRERLGGLLKHHYRPAA